MVNSIGGWCFFPWYEFIFALSDCKIRRWNWNINDIHQCEFFHIVTSTVSNLQVAHLGGHKIHLFSFKEGTFEFAAPSPFPGRPSIPMAGCRGSFPPRSSGRSFSRSASSSTDSSPSRAALEKTTEEKGPSIGRRKGRRGIGGLLTNILGWVMEWNRKESPTFQFIHVHLSALQPYFTAKLRRGKVRISLCIDLRLKVEGHVMRLRVRALATNVWNTMGVRCFSSRFLCNSSPITFSKMTNVYEILRSAHVL